MGDTELMRMLFFPHRKHCGSNTCVTNYDNHISMSSYLDLDVNRRHVFLCQRIDRNYNLPYTYTQRKKGTKTVPLGYFCYKWYPFFKGVLFLSTPGLMHGGLLYLAFCENASGALVATGLIPATGTIMDSQIVLLGVLFWYPFFSECRKESHQHVS